MPASTNPVPLLDLQAQYEPLKPQVLAEVERLMDSQQFILGQPVADLETRIAEFVGSAHAIGCASGTDALILSLAALGVGEGDVVVTTPFSFFSTASCAYRVGARVRFVDIDPATFNIAVDPLEEALDGASALVPVHLFGQCADLDAILEITGRRDVPVVEDAAQALGAHHVGSGIRRRAGSVGQLGCYSFFPSKNLGAFGDAGMVVTDDATLADSLRSLRVHGGKQMYRHDHVGWNSRLDALQAVILGIKLPHLDTWSQGRAANADRYDRWLTESGLVDSGAVQLPYRAPYSDHIFNQYTLRVRDRDALREHLRAEGIGHSVYYPVPLHLQPCFADLGYQRGDFPVAEAACESVVSLPIYPELTQKQQERVVDALSSFYSAVSRAAG